MMNNFSYKKYVLPLSLPPGALSGRRKGVLARNEAPRSPKDDRSSSEKKRIETAIERKLYLLEMKYYSLYLDWVSLGHIFILENVDRILCLWFSEDILFTNQ